MSLHIIPKKKATAHLPHRFVDRDMYMHTQGGGIGHFLKRDKEIIDLIPEDVSPNEHDDVELDPAYLVGDGDQDSKDDEDQDIAGLSDTDESPSVASEDSDQEDWDEAGDST